MGSQAMERDFGGVELGESPTKVALATTGKANCDPTQTLEATANSLLAGCDRFPRASFGGSEAGMTQGEPVERNDSMLRQHAGGAPHTPALPRATRKVTRWRRKRRRGKARPWIAGSRLQQVQFVPIRRAEG